MADVKLATPASSALTITLASLGTSSALTAGRESNAVDNSSNLYEDYLLGGKVTTGTTPTAGVIEVWVVGQVEDTPTYPDVFDGTDSAETVTARDILFSHGKLAAVMDTGTTSDRTYWFGPISIASLFGGVVPDRFVVFVVHNTAVALNSTGSNHAIWVTPVYRTVT